MGGIFFVMLIIFFMKGPSFFFHLLVSFGAKVVIAGFLLYGVNYFLGVHGVFVPINMYTLLFSGGLGIPGVAVLAVLQKVAL